MEPKSIAKHWKQLLNLPFLFTLLLITHCAFADINADTYNTGEVKLLRSMDKAIDAAGNLNWGTESDPSKLTGVLWDDQAPKQVRMLWVNNKNLEGNIYLDNFVFMRDFWGFDNNFTSISAIGHFALRNLLCSNNQLTSLRIEGVTNLEVVRCNNNKLSSIDLSGLPSITELNIADNQLTAIDVSGLVTLKSLNVSNNNIPLSELPLPSAGYTSYTYAPQNTAFEAETYNLGYVIDYSSEATIGGNSTYFTWFKDGVEIDFVHGAKYKPNAAGKYYCEMTNTTFPGLTITSAPISIKVLPHDEDGDGLYDEDVAALRTIREEHPTLQANWLIGNEANWSGLEWNQFENPKRLISFVVKDKWLIGTIDFTPFAELYTLDISGNRLSGCIVNGLNLHTFNCNGNVLESINISNMANLYSLDCGDNNLDNLDLTGCSWINVLNCSDNELAILNLNDLGNLQELNCSYNNLTSIDFSNSSKYTSIDVNNNQLSEIEVSSLSHLISLNCSNNQIPISGLPFPDGSISNYVYSNQTMVLPKENMQVGDVIRYETEEIIHGQASTFKWRKSYANLEGETGTTLNTLLYGNGYYDCVITNPGYPNLQMCITKSIRVDRMNQELQSPIGLAMTYADTSVVFPVVLNSGLPVTFQSITGNNINIHDSIVDILSAGDAQFKISNEGNIQYNPFTDYLFFTIRKAESPISELDHIVTTFDLGPITLNATNPQNFPIVYEANNDTVVSIDDNVLNFIGVGSTTITAKHSGNENYSSDAEVFSLQVMKGNAPIIGAHDFHVTYGSGSVTFDCSNSQDFEIIYDCPVPGTTINGNVFTASFAHNFLVNAWHNGSENYSPYLVSFYVHVEKANQKAILDNVNTYLNGPDIQLPYQTDQGFDLNYTSSDERVVTVENGILKAIGIGNATITANAEGNGNYLVYESTFNVEVSAHPKQNQQIENFADITKVITDANFGLNATATSGLEIEYTASNNNISINGNEVTLNECGTVEITARQAGNDTYFATEQVITLTIYKAQQTLDNLTNLYLASNSDNITLPSTSDQNLEVSYTSLNKNVVTVTGNVLSVVGIGEAQILITNNGNDKYLSFEKTITVTVTAHIMLSQSILNFNDTTCSILEERLIFNAESTSGLPVNYIASSDLVSITNNLVSFNGTGKVQITALQGGNEDYLATSQTIILTILKANQEILGDTIWEGEFDDDHYTLNYTATSGLDIDFTTNDEHLFIENGVAYFDQVGEYSIIATQSGNETYQSALINIHLVVMKSDQSISGLTDLEYKVTEQGVVLPAKSDSPANLNLRFLSTNKDVVRVDENGNVTFVAVGEASIVIHNDGNTNYNAVSDTIFVTVQPEKTSQIIDGLTDLSFTFGDSDFELPQFTSAGLPVSYLPEDANIITVNNNILQILHAGVTYLNITQPGNNLFEPFSWKVRVEILKAPQYVIPMDDLTVQMEESGSELNVETSVGFEALLKSKNEKILYFEGNKMFFSTNGEVEVMAFHPGTDDYQPSDTISFLVKIELKSSSGVKKVSTLAVKAYPNPCNGILNIDCNDFGTVRIINSIGRCCMEQTIDNTGAQIIDISDLMRGIYTLVFDSDGSRQTQRITIY